MSKKRIGIVALGYAWLPCEKGPSRFYYIANMFAEAGFEVDLIGSSFQHFEKKPRDIEEIQKQTYNFHNIFIPVPSYKKNIDLRRIWSNYIAVKHVLTYLSEYPKYDLIYCAIPANNIAASVSEYCQKENIPFVIDIEDLWPEAMHMVFHMPVISNILYYPMKRDAEIAYRNASAVIGTSDDYTNRAFYKRKKDIEAATVYVGCDIIKFDQGVQAFSSLIKKSQDEFWVTYAGSIGTSYDIKTLVHSAAILEERGYEKIHFKIMGTGPMLEEIRSLVDELGCRNVDMMGYVEYSKMAAYLTASDVVVNSFIKGAPQSIVNKIGDYLASGKPMINTLANGEFVKIINQKNVGINIEAENPEQLVKAIIDFWGNREKCTVYGKNARVLAEENFDRKNSYLRIVDVVQKLLIDK